ncbi:hypothetical protein [Enterocloster bolteae]|nr:hypothetical protein [Enterocloster bolteae]MCQ5146810.1 hypothetical protein [Enterocloster bolteae]
MKRQAKWFLIPCAAMALTMGSALVSFAAIVVIIDPFAIFLSPSGGCK